MSVVELSLVLMLLLFAILGSGVWIALALATCGFVAILTKMSTPAGQVFATSIWAASDSWDLTALPMFIWMGEILYRTKLSDDMFEGLAPWVQKLPGRLLHVNVIGCAIFAAVSGSSAATCATIGRIALPELLKRGYDEKMAVGTLAGSGTLGLLIPPSIIMIVYATATDQSIARLFIAGVLPGIMLAALFMGFIAVWALLNRQPHAAARSACAVPRAHQGGAPAHPGDAADPRRHRLDLWRAGVRHRSGRGRRVLVAGAVVVVGHADQGRLPRRAAGRDPHLLHDRLHPGGRRLSHRGHGLHRHSDRARRMDRRLQAAGLGPAHRAHRVLHCCSAASSTASPWWC